MPAFCQDCNTEIDEAMDTPQGRRPCPSCGSTKRRFEEVITDKLTAGDMMHSKGYVGGLSKRKGLRFESKDGASLSKSLGRFVKLNRLLDYEGNRYVEKVVDPATGKVLREVDEPLSDHQGRGSAKSKRRDEKQSGNITTTQSAEIPIAVFGPPGVRGELHVLAMMQDEKRVDHDRLNDTSERLFQVSARLSKVQADGDAISGAFGPEDGGSYLLQPAEAVRFFVQCADGKFEIQKNSKGEMSFVQFQCAATGSIAARKKFLLSVLPFLDHMSFVANCPVVVAMLRVEDTKNDAVIIEYVSPYRKSTINPHVCTLFTEMAPVYAMFREAKNSNSDFYRFLCYYKILEGLAQARATIFSDAKTRGIELERTRDIVPLSTEGPIKYKEYEGKPISRFIDQVMRPQFRNAIAHFVTEDGAILNMSEPDHLDKFAEILLVSENCVRTAVGNHETLLKNLREKNRDKIKITY